MSRPEIIEVIIEFFLNLAKSPKVCKYNLYAHNNSNKFNILIVIFQGAELLQVNKISYLLTVPLGNFVSKLETMVGS